jgi:hypothetical protein
MPSVITLNVVMLSVDRLNVGMLSVVAPCQGKYILAYWTHMQVMKKMVLRIQPREVLKQLLAISLRTKLQLKNANLKGCEKLYAKNTLRSSQEGRKNFC